MEGRIKAEWDRLRKVVVHRPGIEMFFGLLDPAASLYERAFSQSDALIEHDMLTHALRSEFNVEVEGLLDGIKKCAEKSPKAKKKLVEAALRHIEFVGNGVAAREAAKGLKENIDAYDLDYFLNIILLMPRISLRGGKDADSVQAGVAEKNPLADLYFMRDQQAVTDKGIFISRMSKPQRMRETELTRLLWEMKGMEIAHEATAPAAFEGGDFMPMKKFAFLGLGGRTNAEGVRQMLEYGQSFDEVGVVHRPTHPLIPSNRPDPMVNMHLDTYCNVAGSGLMIGSKMLFRRARVDVYVREGEHYRMEKGRTNLYDYSRSKGFEIIDLSILEQISYASNFLCIKDHTILAVNSGQIMARVLGNLREKAMHDRGRYGRLFSQATKDYASLSSPGHSFPNRKEMCQNGVDFYAVDMGNITGGYGGAHCMTAAMERR